MSFTEEITAGLDRMGQKYEVVNGGKHPKLMLEVNGRTVKYPIPYSPSDHRAAKNCLSEIRKIIGWKDSPVDFVKVSRTANSGVSGGVRISFPRAVVDRMFGSLPYGDDRMRVDANFNKKGRYLHITPRGNGARKLGWVASAGKNKGSMVANLAIQNSVFGLRTSRVKGEEFKVTWLTAGSGGFTVRLPEDWWELPKAEPLPVTVVPQQSDAKTVAEMVNDLLSENEDMRVKIAEDGRSIKFVKVTVVEEEI